MTAILAEYTTSSDLTSKLNKYVTSSTLSSKLNSYVTSSSLSSQLSNYLKTSGGTTTQYQTLHGNFLPNWSKKKTIITAGTYTFKADCWINVRLEAAAINHTLEARLNSIMVGKSVNGGGAWIYMAYNFIPVKNGDVLVLSSNNSALPGIEVTVIPASYVTTTTLWS